MTPLPFSKASLLIFVTFASALGFAQTQTYRSSVDQNLSIRKILVLPMVDNVKGIYATPIGSHLLEVLNNDRRFEIEPVKSADLKPESFEDKPELVQQLLKAQNAQGLLTSRLVRGPKGISVRMILFGGPEGLPLVQEKLEDFSGFETQDLMRQSEILAKNLLYRLPYQAVVTSRKGQMLTINAGAKHGLKVGDEAYVILISNVERHPKFKFLTKVDREIMGKLKIGKVDESVSFASLTGEREANLIQPGFKVSWSEMLRYPEAGLTQNGDLIPQLGERPEAGLAYGQSPREWRTGESASFGKVSLLAGITQTSISSAWNSGESPSSSNPLSPGIRLEGEMWLDPQWQMNLSIEQMATKLSNGISGSSPDSLNVQMQELGLSGSYNFLVEPENFWGPKFQVLAGFSKISIFVDDSSPRAYTSKDYSGLAFGLGGSFPLVTEGQSRLLLGGKFLYFWSPSLSESPTSSGSSTNKLSHFNIFLEYGLSRRMAFRGDLNFKQASSSFSDGTGSSASANFVSVMGGASFYF